MLCQAHEVAVMFSRAALVDAVRTSLLQPGAVTDGFQGLDVTAADGFLTVRFRWKLDPNTFLIRIPLPDGRGSPLTGVPMDSAEEWAGDLSLALMEQLDTGFLRRTVRTRRGEETELDWDRRWEKSTRSEYYVSAVALGLGPHPGEHLARAGFDVTEPRRAAREGRLVTWLHAYVNNAQGRPFVGHAAITRDPTDATRGLFDLLNTAPHVPDDVPHELARHCTYDAAEAGCLTVTTSLTIPLLPTLGFVEQGSSRLTLATLHMAT